MNPELGSHVEHVIHQSGLAVREKKPEIVCVMVPAYSVIFELLHDNNHFLSHNVMSDLEVFCHIREMAMHECKADLEREKKCSNFINWSVHYQGVPQGWREDT